MVLRLGAERTSRRMPYTIHTTPSEIRTTTAAVYAFWSTKLTGTC